MEVNQKYNAGSVDLAIEKGIQYLLSIIENGRWKGFPTLAGESDIWVTGFVLTHIQHLCKQSDAIGEAQHYLLQSRHAAGGWAYSSSVPPDADSTACCLQALRSCKDFTEFDAKKAKTFLWSHFTGKGISTYKTDSGISEFIAAPSNEFIIGWTSAHPDVSIAAVLADAQNENVMGIINWLKELQTDQGFINSYWWRGPYYTTTLFLRALSKIKDQIPKEHAALIVKTLVQEQLADGGFGLDSSAVMNPFTTALALESFTHLSFMGQRKESTLCGNALLHAQLDNGSWAGDYILRIPAPFITDPGQVTSWNNADGGGNSLIEDKGGLFTTAMCCYALDCWRNTETKNNTI